MNNHEAYAFSRIDQKPNEPDAILQAFMSLKKGVLQQLIHKQD